MEVTYRVILPHPIPPRGTPCIALGFSGFKGSMNGSFPKEINVSGFAKWIYL